MWVDEKPHISREDHTLEINNNNYNNNDNVKCSSNKGLVGPFKSIRN